MASLLTPWLLWALLQGQAAPGPNPYLAQAKALHGSLEYKRCVERLDQATRWENALADRVEIEIYFGLCKMSLGREREARDHFSLALTLDRGARLPELSSPKIEAVFREVRERLPAAEAPSSAVAPSPLPVAPELVAAPPPPARRSLLLPAVLAGTGLLAGVVGGLLGSRAGSLEQKSQSATYADERMARYDEARSAALGANLGYGAAGVALAGAAVLYLLHAPAPAR